VASAKKIQAVLTTSRTAYALGIVKNLSYSTAKTNRNVAWKPSSSARHTLNATPQDQYTTLHRLADGSLSERTKNSQHGSDKGSLDTVYFFHY